MKHKWKELPLGQPDFGYYGKRVCTKCRLVQLKSSRQHWGKVIGYSWWPKEDCKEMSCTLKPT